MPIELNEDDMQVVLKLQEAKNTTIQRAKDFYRIQVKKLANPDISNRSEIILENFQRGRNGNSADVFDDKPKKAAKAKKVAKVKAAKPEKTPRVEVSLPELSREVELKQTEQPYVFTANLFGKKHAVILAEIDHGKGAESRFGYIGVSARRLDLAKKYAKENDLPLAICATVRVKGRLDQGYAVPLVLFEKYKLESKHALTLGKEARSAYQADGWAGVKFTEAKVEKKAA